METKEITPREQHVLTEMVKGKSRKQIAASLGISPRTIDTHMKNISLKTGHHSATAIIVWALKNGYN